MATKTATPKGKTKAEPKPAPPSPALAALAKAVNGADRAHMTVVIELPEPLTLPLESVGIKSAANRSVVFTELEITLVVSDEAETVLHAKAWGQRLAAHGGLDGRSRPGWYELPADWRTPLAQAVGAFA